MLTPRENPHFIGHTEALLWFDRALERGRLPHAVMLTGPRGIGKATLAYRVARRVLTGSKEWHMPPESPLFKRMSSGAHADLLVIEQEFDEKKGELAQEIPVDDVRRVGEFFSMTAAESAMRVVVVDAADALNPNAANALLKVLEEPPPGALLLLVSHAPGRLLPTIRSRCQMVKLAPLSAEDFLSVLRKSEPELAARDGAALALLADGSPGLALELGARDALAAYDRFLRALTAGGAKPHGAMWEFAQTAAPRGGKGGHAQWQMLERVILKCIQRCCEAAGGGALKQEMVAGEAELLHKLGNMRPAEEWARAWSDIAASMTGAARQHLDLPQALLGVLERAVPRAA